MTDTASPISVANDQPRLNRRQAAKVRTRQRVLEAARALFAERGYDPATIRDIAKGAGMSTGAVFANFQDKAELFEAVLSDDFARLAEVMRNGDPADAPVRDRLLGVLNAGYHGSLDQLPLVQAIIARAWFQPVESEMRARAAAGGLVEVVDGILEDGVRSGQLRQDADLNLLAELIWDAYLSNFRRAAYDGWGIEQLSGQIARQLDVILAGALARQ